MNHSNSLADNRYKTVNHEFIQPMKPVPLFSSEQIYEMEKQWFAQGNEPFALMKQASWQGAYWIEQNYQQLRSDVNRYAIVWVGAGNNGGDGWLIAHYLRCFGWQVRVIEVAQANTEIAQQAKQRYLAGFAGQVQVSKRPSKQQCTQPSCQDSNLQSDLQWKHGHYQHEVGVMSLQQEVSFTELLSMLYVMFQQIQCTACVHIDAMFGIGLTRIPKYAYRTAIEVLNHLTQKTADNTVIAVDIPSGLLASTGQVFESIAVHADVTLCMLARKVGLYIKSGLDYAGRVVDIPLVPYTHHLSDAIWLHTAPKQLLSRKHDSHKGSYGHVLMIGGNCIQGSQGMGGAVILSASSALSVGVGKVTVACHPQFHGALIASVPNAMSLNLCDMTGVKSMIAEVDAVAIGMGLGRDEQSAELFLHYLDAMIEAKKSILIDADALYHLASLWQQNHAIVAKLYAHAQTHAVYYTPHSGEASRLLAVATSEVEENRIKAIQTLAKCGGGSWLLKGAGSLVWSDAQCYVCLGGNAGMATAGMGDVLSGLAVGLLAQSDLAVEQKSLLQAVLIHAYAGDTVARHRGQWGLQAQDMPDAIAQTMQTLTTKSR